MAEEKKRINAYSRGKTDYDLQKLINIKVTNVVGTF
jgi:hypothetical protein